MKQEYIILFSVAILLLGCVQPPETPSTITEQEISVEWTPNGIISDGEYSRSVHLYGIQGHGYSGGDLEVHWKNDEENIYMALKGETDGWVSIGFDPVEWMKESDLIVGAVNGDAVIVEDQYSTGNYGPHLQDELLGGTNDILTYGGGETDGYTIIEFKRKLYTKDEFDKALVPGDMVSIIWGMADIDDPQLKHNVAVGEGYIKIDTNENEDEDVRPASSMTTLTSSEEEGIFLIREEEKMARDLYMALYDEFKLPILTDTAASEQKHMDSVKILIEIYDLDDPVKDEKDHGNFSNLTIQAYYDDFLERGRQSPEEALRAGAGFEEIDIRDLEHLLATTDKENIKTVYQGLLSGSRKHLRSYVRALEDRGIEYSPQYLSQENFERIVNQ